MQADSTKNAAATSAPAWTRFLLPAATDLVFLGVLFSLSCSALAERLLGDAGIGWHIRNGELMLRNHAITRVDPFSSTMAGQSWYAWEWLYDLLIAGVHHWMGLNGVVFFTAVAIAATFALALRVAVARGSSLPAAVILLAFAVGASAIHLLARPHVFSWLLAVIWFAVLDSCATKPNASPNRRLYQLPPLMLLWVNLHGGFVTGFVLLGIYLVSEMLSYFAGGANSIHASRVKNLSAVTGLCLFATFLNPYGYKLHVHIVGYLSNHFLMNHIEEFRSPDFHGVAQQCFVVLLLIAIVALAAAREKPRVSRVLVIAFAAGSGLYAARNLPVSSLLLMVTVSPMLSRVIADAKNQPQMAAWLRALCLHCESFGSRMGNMELSLRGHLWPLAGAVFGFFICLHGGRLGASQIMDAHFSAKRFPIEAVDLLAQRGDEDPVFCPDYWGGYLIYRLYPEIKVVADDRHDLYGEAFFKQYLKVVQVEPGWEAILDQYRVRQILIPATSSLANVLRQSTQWKLVYEDKVGALFQREMPPGT